MTKSILILYGSTTGNVEELANYLATTLKEKLQCKASLKNVATIKDEFVFSNSFDMIILCCSTWGTEFPCLQEDFELFWKKINTNSLKDKKILIFGIGDFYYPHFCAAVDILTKDLLTYEAKLILNGIKIADPWIDKKALIDNALNKAVSLVF